MIIDGHDEKAYRVAAQSSAKLKDIHGSCMREHSIQEEVDKMN